MQLYKESASNLSKMLKNKEISSTELTKSVFEQIHRVEDDVCAYITLNEEKALKAAKAVDDKISKGEQLSPIAGIPVGVKDNIVTEGLLTSCASKMLYNFVPPYNATVTEKLISNDAIITGKLNMDEFAMGSSTETSFFKKTKNPRNLQYVPGGSSGGSAAAVALGIVPFALGSDTGDSIRKPAAFGGIVGFKPTYGRISRYGLFAFASSLDHLGVFARNVKDAAIVTDVVKGHDSHDMTSLPNDDKEYSKLLKQWRI